MKPRMGRKVAGGEAAHGDGDDVRVGVGAGLDVGYPDVLAAAERISEYVRRTPLVRSDYLSELTGGEVYLKLECWQLLGAFKVRGMVNRALTLTPAERAAGIVVASSGNHGVAASWCGQKWGFAVDVFVPRATVAAKVDKIRRYGARLHLVGDNYDEAHGLARQYLAEQAGAGQVWVDSCSDPVAIAGHGTAGLEMAEQMPEIDEVLVPVGGGGLITGIGLALGGLAPDVTVTGVQTEACPAMLASLRDGVAYETYPSEPSLCEALVGGVGRIGFALAPRCIDRIVLASEAAIARAVPQILAREQLVAEPSATVGWAYIASHPERFRGRHIVAVITGANADYAVLRRLICDEGF